MNELPIRIRIYIKEHCKYDEEPSKKNIFDNNF